MPNRSPRQFRARFYRNDFGEPSYILKCHRCGTHEHTFDQLPHDVAEVHARCWHGKPFNIPQGWTRARSRETS